MLLDAHSKNKHKHMSSKYKHSTQKSLLQAYSLELYKKGTYAIEVHRAPRKLKLLGWARTLTQHIDQLIELVAMIHCLCFHLSVCLPMAHKS